MRVKLEISLHSQFPFNKGILRNSRGEIEFEGFIGKEYSYSVRKFVTFLINSGYDIINFAKQNEGDFYVHQLAALCEMYGLGTSLGVVTETGYHSCYTVDDLYKHGFTSYSKDF